MKHITSSQSEKRMSRGRTQRILESVLDSRQGNNHINPECNSSGILGVLGGIGSDKAPADITPCFYLERCKALQHNINKKCYQNFKYEGCQVYKFFEKFPSWNGGGR